MPALTEKEKFTLQTVASRNIYYGMKRNVCIIQKYKKSPPKLIDMIIITLLYEKRVEKSFMKSCLDTS